MLLIASTFCGSGARPFELMMWPKNGVSVHLILYLSGYPFETGFSSTFHICFQVCIMVSEVTSVDDDVISNASYTRLISKSFINFLLKDVLCADQTEGKPQESISTMR